MEITHPTTPAQEVAVSHSTTITPHAATEPGALDGFLIECTCGERVSYSLEAFAQVEARRHLAWHQEVGR